MKSSWQTGLQSLNRLRIAVTIPPPNWFGGVDRAFAVDMAAELNRMGATVLRVEVSAFIARDPARIDAAISKIRSFNADVVLSLPNAGYVVICNTSDGRNVFCDVLELPTILIWDHGILQFSQMLLGTLPEHPEDARGGCIGHLRSALNHPLYAHYSPDRGHIAAIESFGVIEAARVHPFIHFAFPVYTHADSARENNIRSRIAFAGNLYLKRSQACAWRAHPLLARIEAGMLEARTAQSDRSFWELLLAEIGKCDEAERRRLGLRPDSTFYWSFLRDAIQYVGNTRARLDLLTGIAHPCDIFGNFVEPEASEGLKGRYGLRMRGNLDCVSQLPSLYRDTELIVDAINTGYISGSSPKVTSCLASGGLILFNYKDDFRAGFGEIADHVMYRNIEHLNSMIDRYLGKPSMRRELSAALREIVFRQFTFGAFCRRVLCDEPAWRQTSARGALPGDPVRARNFAAEETSPSPPGRIKAVAELQETADALLDAVGDDSDVTLLRNWGNRGDDLSHAGLRRLLRGLRCREHDLRELHRARGGATAIITGGGASCKPYHPLAELLPEIEARYSRVIVFPSSFDTSEPLVRKALARTKAVVFARECASYEQIRHLCDARLAHDSAFFFDFTPYLSGIHSGVLNAFRTDAEAPGKEIPAGNRDISDDCETLDEWLWAISRHDLIRTDRAHVLIAAVMLDKRVEWRSSSHHKVPAIVEFSIGSSQATRIVEGEDEAGARPRGSDRAAVSTVSGGTNGQLFFPYRCEDELNRIAGELEQNRAEVQALRQSWSWRLTAPLRLLVDAGRFVMYPARRR